MIFKVILFFVVTTVSNLYPMKRHTYNPLMDQLPKETIAYKPTRHTFNVTQQDHTLPTQRLITLLQIVTNKHSSTYTKTEAPQTKLTPQNLTSIKLSNPLDDLIIFKSGPTTNQGINDARTAINELAYALELSLILQEQEQLPDLYKYLNKLKTTFKQVPLKLALKDPHEIVAHYIEECYRPLVQNNVTTLLKRTPQLYVKESIQNILKQQNNDKLSLQLVEILHKLTLIWDYYAQLFFTNEHDALVTMSYPWAQLSIQDWIDITYQKANELYETTEPGKKAIQENMAQHEAQRALNKEKAQRDLENARAKRQKEIDEFNAYKERVLSGIESSGQAIVKEHAEALSKEMKTDIRKTKITTLQEQATDLNVMRETIIISDPTIEFINDALETALHACDTISQDNLAEVDKIVLASLIGAYEWLQEPRDMISEQDSISDNDHKEPYDDSYLHLKYKFNQKNMLAQVKYMLKKIVYTWNVYAFIRYSGKLETLITLKFSAKNNPRKSISDWIKFTNKAGFSYSGQFEKILKHGPTKSIGSLLFDAYRWLSQTMRRKPTPKLTAEQGQKLMDEAEREALIIAADEQAEFAKIKKLLDIKEDRIKNPVLTPKAQATKEEPITTPTTEKSGMKESSPADFDPEFAVLLKDVFTKK